MLNSFLNSLRTDKKVNALLQRYDLPKKGAKNGQNHPCFLLDFSDI